jgi:hypothetical protein
MSARKSAAVTPGVLVTWGVIPFVVVFASLELDIFGEQCILYPFKPVTHHLAYGFFHVIYVAEIWVGFQCPP